MSHKFLIQLECDLCHNSTQTTAEVHVSTEETYDWQNNRHVDNLVLKVNKDLPEGWSTYQDPNGTAHKCPKHTTTK